MAYAHDYTQLIHQDIKPANVLMECVNTRDGADTVEIGGNVYRPQLTDFGLAVTAGAARGELTVGGTLPYLSPEQCRGEWPTPRSDVWGLGVVLYEPLRGERPFGDARDGRTADEVKKAIGSAPLTWPPSSSVPRDIRRACERALAKVADWLTAARAAMKRRDAGLGSSGKVIYRRPL